MTHSWKDEHDKVKYERDQAWERIKELAAKIESDAKVITEKDVRIVELEAGHEIQMRNLDAAEKVIAALREALETIKRTTFSGSESGEDYMRGNCDAHVTCSLIAVAGLRAYEQKVGERP